MSMFSNDQKLVYMGETTRTSKNGNPFTLVTIGDPAEMQKHEFFKADSCNTSGVVQGDLVKINVNLDTQGYNQRLSLVGISSYNGK